MAATQQKKEPMWVKFLNSGLAGMGATCCVQPIDLIKTRMQLAGEGGSAKYRSSLHAAMDILQKDGLFRMYNGLSAGLLRQATYTTTRLGVYQYLEDTYKEKNGSLPGFAWKLLFGMTSGGIGAIIGTPAEITLVRMTADGRLPPAERRNYKHAFDALARITRDEGVLTLWRGWQPTVIRAMVLNAAQLAVYSQAKQSLIANDVMKDGTPAHFVASLISGFMSTVVSIPIDITKTRLQNMKNNEYSGTADVLMKVVRNEGFFALWKGFTPYFLRLGPHTIITFLIMEQLNAFSKGWYQKH